MTDDLITALKTVFDPEIPVDIYELGLIYRVDIDDDRNVAIDMTLTAPGCPVAGEMPGWVENAVATVQGVQSVKVNMVFDPPWDQSRMSDEARVALHSIWQRRWLALAIAWGVAVVGWFVVAQMPSRYQSQARVFVQMQSIIPGGMPGVPTDGQKDVDRIRQLIKKVSADRTVLMVEHNMSVVASIADTITVLKRGATLAEGPYDVVSKNPAVIEAYMGSAQVELKGAH